MCDRYELSISGKNVLSCEEKETCTDLFVPAKCELYYNWNEIREFDINQLGYTENLQQDEKEVPAASSKDEEVSETKKKDQDSAASSVTPAPVIPSNC